MGVYKATNIIGEPHLVRAAESIMEPGGIWLQEYYGIFQGN